VPWSLDYRPVRCPGLLDEFFLALGKALYLATEYEAKCGAYLNLVRLTNALSDGHGFDAALALTNAMREKMLGGTIAELRQSIREDSIDLLDRAREARNLIAHEIAKLGALSLISSDALESRTETLRHALKDLARGDNIVSKALYEIGEREPAPQTIQSEYPLWIDRWVFPDSEP
jgi:hypothetical protein